MRVIHLFAPGPIGGAEKVVASGVCELARQGHEVELWLIREKRDPRWARAFASGLDSSVKTRVFDCVSAYDRSLIRELRAALTEQASVLHTHAFKAAFYGHAAKSTHTKHVHTHHGQTAHTLKVRVYEGIERFIMKRADQVHAVSTAMEKHLKGAGISRVVLVENPLVLRDSPMREERAAGTSLLYVGRLSIEKGVDVLLRALHQAQKKYSLTIVGDGAERKNLEDLAHSLGMQNIIFAGFQNSVQEFLTGADALVMPSRREGLPLTLIEALCAGLPVIASRVGGIPDFVEHGVNGLLCDPDDVDELAKQLEDFLLKRDHLTSNARSRVERLKKRFSIDEWAKKTSQHYASVLNQS